MPGLEIREDLSAAVLRQHAKREKNPRVARRMMAIANALDGMSRELSARLAGMDRQALRDWVVRYNEAGLAGLRDRWGPDRPRELAAVKAKILSAAAEAGKGQPVYRIVDVARLIEERTGVRYSISRTYRIMQDMNLSYQKTRQVHPKADPRAQRTFKKSSGHG